MTRDDLALAESPADRTARLRALRLSGAKPEPKTHRTADTASPSTRAERLLVPTEKEREAFIIGCWGDCESSTYDIAKFMEDEFGIRVTEAEVCKVLRRHGERREPWKGRNP